MSPLPRPFDAWTTYEGHGGIDYPQPTGTPIRASGTGVVDFSGWYSDRGGYAKFITYHNGDRHGYYHLVDLDGLSVGAAVTEGTTFGYVGNTGYSTGPHLHHEVWRSSSIIRPPDYWDHVDAARYVGQPQPAGGTGSTEEYPDMFIANVRNGNWYLVVPQGSAKPHGIVLGAKSGADKSGLPVLNFPGDFEVNELKEAVTGIS